MKKTLLAIAALIAISTTAQADQSVGKDVISCVKEIQSNQGYTGCSAKAIPNTKTDVDWSALGYNTEEAQQIGIVIAMDKICFVDKKEMPMCDIAKPWTAKINWK